MDCVSLAFLVNESKYRPLIICFAESALFFFFFFCYEYIYDEIWCINKYVFLKKYNNILEKNTLKLYM
jgi:hypothetical protein